MYNTNGKTFFLCYIYINTTFPFQLFSISFWVINFSIFVHFQAITFRNCTKKRYTIPSIDAFNIKFSMRSRRPLYNNIYIPKIV